MWQTAEKTSLFFPPPPFSLVHICPSDGSNPRVYYQTSDAKPIHFLTPKRAKKMNRGVWTNWHHHSHGPSEKKFSNVKVLPSVSSFSAFISPCLIKLSNFLLPIRTVQKFYIYSKVWASTQARAHTQFWIALAVLALPSPSNQKWSSVDEQFRDKGGSK